MNLTMLSLKSIAATLGGPTTAHVLGLLIVASLKGSVLLVLAWLLTRALRNASASARHLVWASALGGMLVMPLLAGVVPSLRVSGLPTVSVPAPVELSLLAPVAAVATTAQTQAVPAFAPRAPRLVP